MPSNRIKHPQWRESHEDTKYPFEDNATLSNDAGTELPANTFLDAAFYPVNGRGGMYISRVVVTTEEVTIYIGDIATPDRCFGTFSLLDPPDEVRIVDEYGRGAGIMVSEALRLSVFQSWGVGEHLFEVFQLGFVAACCMPVPAIGVQGILLDDGTLVTGDAWIVGENGVVLTCEEVSLDSDCDEATVDTQYAIRVDIVGDPLFRRTLCAPGLFETPRFLESITFQKGGKTLQCGPGELGNVNIGVSSHTAPDTILRVRAVKEGMIIEAVGEQLRDIR
jgi:hypothetical protein